MTKLIAFDGAGKGPSLADELKASVENTKESIPYMIEYMAQRAQLKHAYYTELVAQGFTEAQALELVAKDDKI